MNNLKHETMKNTKQAKTDKLKNNTQTNDNGIAIGDMCVQKQLSMKSGTCRGSAAPTVVATKSAADVQKRFELSTNSGTSNLVRVNPLQG